MGGEQVSKLFKTASRRAVRETLASGGSVTVKQGKKIVRKSASGKVTTVVEMDRAYRLREGDSQLTAVEAKSFRLAGGDTGA